MSEIQEPQKTKKTEAPASAGMVMTPEALAAIVNSAVSAAIQESKKPTLLEQQVLDKQKKADEDKQQERLENAQEELRGIENRKAFRQICLHKRKNGTSRAVHVANGDFFICQECRIVVFKEPQPSKESGLRIPEAVYDTRLYNEFMQTAKMTDL